LIALSPKELVCALINTPEVIEQILETLQGEHSELEHYWGLSMENNKVKIHYEYFGEPDHIPNKFMDKTLIPLHNHVPLKIPDFLAKMLNTELSKWSKDELDMRKNMICGSTNASWDDLACFIWDDIEIFGICSLYNNYLKFSFYNPTGLNDKELYCILDAAYNYKKEVDAYVEGEDYSLESIINSIKKQYTMWHEIPCLKKFNREPYTSHLIIPI